MNILSEGSVVSGGICSMYCLQFQRSWVVPNYTAKALFSATPPSSYDLYNNPIKIEWPDTLEVTIVSHFIHNSR